MKLVTVTTTDGRDDYLARAVATHHHQILHPVHARILIDDTGDPVHAAILESLYPEYTVVAHDTKRGLAAAVNTGFAAALTVDPDYILWLEDDFTITRPLPIAHAADILHARPSVAQMLFQRQPIAELEVASGSVAGAMGGEQRSGGEWIEHGHIFSLNPCLIQRSVIEGGWPKGNEAEMTGRLLAQGYTFGVWRDGPLVHHIGEERAAGWAL